MTRIKNKRNENHHHSDRTTPPTCSCPNIVKWRLPGLENQHTAPQKKKKKKTSTLGVYEDDNCYFSKCFLFGNALK
jgi:hypothetical protein